MPFLKESPASTHDIATVLSTPSLNIVSKIDALIARRAIKAKPAFSNISTGLTVIRTRRKYLFAPQFNDKDKNVVYLYCYAPLSTTKLKTEPRYWE